MKILLALLAFVPFSSFSQFLTNDGPPVISVSGAGEIKVAPDEACLRVGVLTHEEDLFQATQKNADAIAAALKYLDEQGIEKKHISTDYVRVTPSFNHNVSFTKPEYFEAIKSIEVKLTDVSRLGEILTGLLAHGVNQVNGIELRSTQFRKYRDEARAMAARAAKEKATALAGELGVTIGRVQSITANDWDGGYSSYRLSANVSQNVVQSIGSSSGDESGALSLGQIGIRATVNVTFRVE